MLRGIQGLLLGCVALAAALPAAPAKPAKPAAGTDVWKLVFTEDFKGKKPSGKLWSRIEAGSPDWRKHMSLRPDLVEVKDGQLHCYGVRNDDRAEDPRPVLTGGVTTRGKLAFLYGKIEVRCRLEAQKGAWPAIWMMPEAQPKGWPNDGEIDIVERLNFDDFVYQTVHSGWTQGHPGDPPRGGRGKIDRDGWNVYALEWTPEKIVWKVNGTETHSYPNVGDDPVRWPWNAPFYLKIDMQLGGSWVGAIDESTLPTAMHIDWVKYYQLMRNGRKVGGPVRPGARK